MSIAVKTPEEFIQAMRAALSTGDLKQAHKLSLAAVEQYPHRDDIQECARILQPTQITSVKRPVDRGWQKSREWVRQQRQNRHYVNQWVAVRDGHLLATGRSVDDVIAQIDSTENVFLTVIY